MAKPPDPLSDSEAHAGAKQNQPGVAKNDRSQWLGRVVGADEFAPAPVKRGSRARSIAIVSVLGVGAVGAGLYAAGTFDHASVAPAPGSAAPAPGSAAPVPAAAASLRADAAVAVADAVPADAAVPAAAAVAKPDAISSVAPPFKGKSASTATKKKPTATKKRAH
jgi:hypothetical protein